MKDRIKQIRKEKKLSQSGFGEALGVSRDVISNYEMGRVVPSELFIKHLCDTYNVNEDWLRTGNGEMFFKTKRTILDELVTAHGLNEREKAIVAAFLDLTPEGRAGVIEYIEKASNNLAATPSRQDIIADDIAATEKKIAKRVKTEL